MFLKANFTFLNEKMRIELKKKKRQVKLKKLKAILYTSIHYSPCKS